MFSIKINNTDITDLIKFQGLKWSRNDIDGANAGRALNGSMIRDYVASKDKLEIECRPLNQSELSMLLALVEPTRANQGTFSVEYTSPRGQTVTKDMYLSSVPASYLINRGDDALWGGVSLHLIEI